MEPEKCRKGNNPYFHPKECDCRPSQVVPYQEDEDVFPPSRWPDV